MNIGKYLRGEDRHVGTARVTKQDKPEAPRLADALERGWLENVDRDAVDVVMIQEELRRLHEVNQELVEALETVAEYWNQDTNHDAMQDACWYMTDTAKAILAKYKEQE